MEEEKMMKQRRWFRRYKTPSGMQHFYENNNEEGDTITKVTACTKTGFGLCFMYFWNAVLAIEDGFKPVQEVMHSLKELMMVVIIR
jgi:topoisomerase-4 subunit A